MSLGSIFNDFRDAGGSFFYNFRALGLPGEGLGLQGPILEPNEHRKSILGGFIFAFFCFFHFLGSVFEVCFPKASGHFFHDFGVGLQGMLESFSRLLRRCCKSSKMQPLFNENTVFDVQRAHFFFFFFP